MRGSTGNGLLGPRGSNSRAGQPLIEVGRLIAALRRHQVRCVVGALSGLAVGLTLAIGLAPGPAASASLLVTNVDDKLDTAKRHDQTDVDVALCAGALVAGQAAGALRVDVTQVQRRYTCAENNPNPAQSLDNCPEKHAIVVDITARGSSAGDATRTAAALSKAFLAQQLARDNRLVAAEAGDLLARREQDELQLSELNRTLAQTTDVAQSQFLLFRQRELSTQSDDMGTQAAALSAAVTTAAASTEVISPARVLPSQLRRRVAITAVIGLVLGGGLAVGSALIAAVLWDRPVRRRDVAEALGAPVVADITLRRSGPRSVHDVGAASAVLARLVRSGPGPVVVLESGCRQAALDLVAATAEKLGSSEQPTVASLQPRGAWIAAVGEPSAAVVLVRAGQQTEASLRLYAADLAHAGIPIAAVFLVAPQRHDQTAGALGIGAQRPPDPLIGASR